MAERFKFPVLALCQTSIRTFGVLVSAEITDESVNNAWQEERDSFSEIHKLAFRSWNLMLRHYFQNCAESQYISRARKVCFLK